MSDEPTDRDALRALAAVATPGPWRWTHGLDSRAMVLADDETFRIKVDGHPDAAYIAAASPDRITALLDDLDAAERVKDGYREKWREACDDLDAAERERDEWQARRDRAVETCRFRHQDGLTAEEWHTRICGAMQGVQKERARAERAEAQVAAIERWRRTSQPTHDSRVTEGYMRAQNDVADLLNTPAATPTELDADERERADQQVAFIESWLTECHSDTIDVPDLMQAIREAVATARAEGGAA